MKYIVIFVLALVALAAAAPQWVYPGVVGTYPTAVGARTVVAGPTVVNSGAWGGAWPWRGYNAAYGYPAFF